MLPDFRLETHFSKWEFRATHHLTASDAESMSMSELLAYATPEQRAEFDDFWLGYTETWGAPDLREAVASTFESRTASDVLCFAGASEGIFAANNVLLDDSSHAIVITPNYQSHETLPVAICEATGVPLDPDDGWSLDIDRVAAAFRPNTKLVTINFPHNPTGAILDHNLPLWDAFFARYPDRFEWQRPQGSCMAFPRYLGGEGVEEFARSLVEESGVLVLPSTIYSSDLGPTPTDRFRIGAGRTGLDVGLHAMTQHFDARA